MTRLDNGGKTMFIQITHRERVNITALYSKTGR